MSHVGQSVLRGDVRYGLTTQGSQFYGFGAFLFIEEQTIARRVVVISNGDCKDRFNQTYKRRLRLAGKAKKGEGGRVPSTPLPAVEIPFSELVVI